LRSVNITCLQSLWIVCAVAGGRESAEYRSRPLCIRRENHGVGYWSPGMLFVSNLFQHADTCIEIYHIPVEVRFISISVCMVVEYACDISASDDCFIFDSTDILFHCRRVIFI